MRNVEAVIFDWAGTTVDYGCFAPVQAFVEVFKHFGIEPTMQEVREPMGMLKSVYPGTDLKPDAGSSGEDGPYLYLHHP